MRPNEYQDLRNNPVPAGFPGRSKVFIQIWYIVSATLFRLSPHALYGWRSLLLRCFGAKIGVGVKVRPSAVVTYPWNVEIGDHSYIGDEVVLYSLARIYIGPHTSVSYRSFLCTGTHNHREVSFPLVLRPIVVQEQSWIAADTFIMPGVTVGAGTVVAARSTLQTDTPPGSIFAGTPAKQVGERHGAPPEAP